MKYLPRFKWSNLTEKLAYDSAVRKKKLHQELTQVKKETNFYMEQMDKNKQIQAIKRKREKKGTESEFKSNSKASEESGNDPKQRRIAISDSQRSTISKSVLSSVFT